MGRFSIPLLELGFTTTIFGGTAIVVLLPNLFSAISQVAILPLSAHRFNGQSACYVMLLHLLSPKCIIAG